MAERAPARDAPGDRPLLVVLVLTAIAALALVARELENARIQPAASGTEALGWFSADPDGLYHARRLERALDEGRVAADDPLLNHPHGALVPWPPYYTHALGALLGPFAPPADAADTAGARHAWIERAVATVPALFACLTAVVLGLAAWCFGGAAAGGVAGGTFALLGASLDYSVPGIGDHHAWATLLAAVVFALTARCFKRGVARTARSAAWLGGLAGAAAGVLVGSWVGGLAHVALVQVALGWLILVHVRRAVAGLVPFGLAFHLALLAAVLPAVLASPWRHEQPWMVINLSWFHVALPALGALVFAPLAWLAPATARARRYPWLLAAGLSLAWLVLEVSDAALFRSLREGLAWAGRDNAFMAYITESQPLLWGQIGGVASLHQKLGYAAWLVVPAWLYAARRALGGEHGLVVWAAALPPMLAQALVQRRFAEVLGVPLAVVLGIAAGALCERSRSLRTRPALAAAAGLVLAALGQWPLLAHAIARTRAGQHTASGPALDDQQSTRSLLRWIHGSTPPESAVLAAWDLGHAIEWAAERASVATNFGSYVGEEGYLAPWRFFLEEDPAAAEALLAERDARYVLILGSFSKDLEVMLRLVRPLERHEFVSVAAGQGPRPTPRWYRTMAARLMLTGKVGDPDSGQLLGDSLGFLRLVHVAAEPLRMPMPIPHTPGAVPAGWVWERVSGALVTARAPSGERLEVDFDVEYPQAGEPRRLRWSAAATAGADGFARVRVPYATDQPSGDGRVLRPRWSLGGRSGELAIPERAVLEGGEVEVP